MTWGHTIQPVSARNPLHLLCGQRSTYNGRDACLRDVAFVASYVYASGRRGTTTRKLYVCREHGRRWATEHGLELPEDPLQLTIRDLEREHSPEAAIEAEAEAHANDHEYQEPNDHD